MKNIILILIALLALSCACPPQYTIRHTDMGYMEFMRRAQTMVKEKVPQWYQEDIKVELDYEDLMHYGHTKETKDGEVIIIITGLSLRLALVEDLAEVYLHEYVHAKIWKEMIALETGGLDEWCVSHLHELHANYVVLTDGAVLGYHPLTKKGVMWLYNEAYFNARGVCPREITEKFPKPAATPWAP